MTDGGRELAHSPTGAPATAGPAPRAVGIPMEQRLAMLREALTNPDVDPAKAQAMAELMWRMEDREREAEFNRDKIAAIRAMPAIYKRGKSDKHRYAKFEDLHRAAMPILDSFNLTIDFRVGSEGSNITVQPILRHRNGLVEEGGIMKAPPDTGPGRNAVQAVGSTTSYLKRHAMKAMLNIIEDGEDDDGRGGALALAGDQMNDRQVRLVEQGQEAFEAGTYQAWYARQLPKDRAWLIATGNHQRWGGDGTLIADSTGEPEPEAEERTPAPPPPPPPPSPPPPADEGGQLALDAAPKPKLTPRQWVDKFKEELGLCRNGEALDDYMERKRDALSRLEKSDPTLWEECNTAYRNQRAALED